VQDLVLPVNGIPLTVTRAYMEGKPQNLEVEVDGVARRLRWRRRWRWGGWGVEGGKARAEG